MYIQNSVSLFYYPYFCNSNVLNNVNEKRRLVETVGKENKSHPQSSLDSQPT